jgi:hypothetical protein
LLWTVVVPTYLACLWVAASAYSRGHGGVVFIGGVVILAAALMCFRSGRRQVLYAVYLACLMAAVLALALEVAVRLHPAFLTGVLANHAYGGYHWYRGGIYARDLHRGPVMIPSFARAMYWNGHTWTHETNAGGYRGPRLERADAVFLGDSMIYGHGVEAAETVPAEFQRTTGLATANLGQQGTATIQELLAFHVLGRPLHPRVVYAAIHPNDVADELDIYGADELRRFARDGLVDGRWPVVAPKFRPRPWWDLVDLWPRRLALPMRVSGLFGAAARLALTPRTGPAPVDPASRAGLAAMEGEPYPAASPGARGDEALAWAANVRALADLDRACRASGARLVVFDLGIPIAFSKAVEREAARLGIAYDAAGRAAFAEAQRGTPVYLAHDGHWTPDGSRVVARALAEGLPAKSR